MSTWTTPCGKRANEALFTEPLTQERIFGNRLALYRYNYVLFTDADVYFRRSITLDDFGEQTSACQMKKVLYWTWLAETFTLSEA
eukprot:1161871-Pelagomonas_calceolata.AAC.5